MVGMTGFEPATSCSQSRRATNCATSRSLIHYTNPRGDCQAKALLLRFAAIEGGAEKKAARGRRNHGASDEQTAEGDPIVARNGRGKQRFLVSLFAVKEEGLFVFAPDLIGKQVSHFRSLLSLNRDGQVMYRESLLREVLFVLGLDVARVVGRVVEVAGHGVRGFAERGEFLQREVEQPRVVGLEREFPAGFQK